MPNTDELPSVAEQHDDSELEQETQGFEPGELCAVDAVDENDLVELEDDEYGTVSEKEACVKNLANRAAQRDLVSRRLQVRDAWKARYFYRGNQHLLTGPKGVLVTPGQAGFGGSYGSESQNDHSKETNVYLICADIIMASGTAGLPSVRFEPQNPTDAADLSASENSEKARLLIERNNKMLGLQADCWRYLWTDSIAFAYTRYVLDAQRFGYDHDVSDDLSYLPESSQPVGTGGATGGEGEEAESSSPSRSPRGSEEISWYGTLEVKIPIQARCQAEIPYLQFSRERDITTMKSAYPNKADSITPSMAAAAESDYERLARTSIMMGMRPSSMTSDSFTYNVTEQRTWLRPEFFVEEEDETLREWLYDTFAGGLMTVICGQEVCEVRKESMDDHWTIVFSRPGDGTHRPALGQPLIPIQEKINDVMDLTHESTMHLIPRTWVDSERVDANALNDTKSKPKQYFKIKRAPGGTIQDNFFSEPPIDLGSWVMVYLQWLVGDLTQLLSGAYPAMSGGDTGANDTMGGIATQRDQALGRIGLAWRNVKEGYAQIIRQAVQCAAKFRKGAMTGQIKSKSGAYQTLRINADDLKGNVLCFPDTDENFPETHAMKKAAVQQIFQAAATNPMFAAILSIPQNQRVARDYVALPEFTIPGSDAGEKQMGQIMLLLDSEPMPNPAVMQAQQQIGQTAAAAAMSGIPIPPEAGQAAQQMLAQIPPEISNPQFIDVDVDDQPAMITAIKSWANSQEGVRAKTEKPNGYKNVILLMKEREAVAQKQQAGAGGAPGKPPSESLSVNLKDIPTPEGISQALAKVGIIVPPDAIAKQDQQDDANAVALQQAKAQAIRSEKQPQIVPVATPPGQVIQ